MQNNFEPISNVYNDFPELKMSFVEFKLFIYYVSGCFDINNVVYRKLVYPIFILQSIQYTCCCVFAVIVCGFYLKPNLARG